MDARLTMERFEADLPPVPVHLPAQEHRHQILPFTLREVGTAEDLDKAVSIRHLAYRRHVPALADQLRRPEALDTADGCTVFLAESKLDGDPIGTMRIQSNRYQPLALERSVELPEWLQDRSLAEATRLGVGLGSVGHAVKIALFKAFYFYCAAVGIEWMVIAARKPLDRQYDALMFDDVFPGRTVPLLHANNIPHRILCLEIATLEERWAAANHPLYEYFFRTQHRDIQVTGLAAPQMPVVPATRSFGTATAA